MKFRNFILAASSLNAGVWAEDGTLGHDLGEWKQSGRASPDHKIDLHIALKPARSWRDIEQVALNVASPSHSNYRRHLSPSELSSLTQPSIDAQDTVLAWLEEHNITGRIRGGIVEASTSVKVVEELLRAEYYRHFRNGETVVRTKEVNISDEVSKHIEFITPTSQWPFQKDGLELGERQLPEQKILQATSVHSSHACDSSGLVTPDCIKKVYNITYTPKPDRTTFAVYGTEAAVYSASDLEHFLKYYNPPAASARAKYTVIGAGDTKEGPGGIGSRFETALDTQTLIGLAWPAKGVLYNNGGVFGPDGTRGKTYDRMVTFLQELIHNDTVPSVVSFSESAPENTLDPAYAKRLCSMMAQVGARGVSLVFSSGDNGPNGDSSTGKHREIFETEFPASCPWVTAVGGTVDLANEVGATQSSLKGTGLGNLGYTSSGGGFSNLFPRPDYQNGFVDGYIDKHVPSPYKSESGYNSSGRGVPDVSAFSSNIPVVQLGFTIGIGGTSGSTPIWAGVVTIINDHLASRGEAPMGFLNPWLYSLRNGELKDIVAGGDNKGACSFGCGLDKTLGYNVTEGWDAVTGLGSPNVGLMVEALNLI